MMLLPGNWSAKCRLSAGVPADESVVGFRLTDDAVVFSLHGMVHEHGAFLSPGKIRAAKEFEFSVDRRTEDAPPADAAFFPRHLRGQDGILRGLLQRFEAVVAVFSLRDVALAE